MNEQQINQVAAVKRAFGMPYANEETIRACFENGQLWACTIMLGPEDVLIILECLPLLARLAYIDHESWLRPVLSRFDNDPRLVHIWRLDTDGWCMVLRGKFLVGQIGNLGVDLN